MASLFEKYFYFIHPFLSTEGFPKIFIFFPRPPVEAASFHFSTIFSVSTLCALCLYLPMHVCLPLHWSSLCKKQSSGIFPFVVVSYLQQCHYRGAEGNDRESGRYGCQRGKALHWTLRLAQHNFVFHPLRGQLFLCNSWDKENSKNSWFRLFSLQETNSRRVSFAVFYICRNDIPSEAERKI